MEIRQLTAADAEVYRDLRLEGLQTNPEAFGASFEEEMDLSIESFASRLKGQEHLHLGHLTRRIYSVWQHWCKQIK